MKDFMDKDGKMVIVSYNNHGKSYTKLDKFCSGEGRTLHEAREAYRLAKERNFWSVEPYKDWHKSIKTYTHIFENKNPQFSCEKSYFSMEKIYV